jgi:hypothetical protein
MRPCQANAVHAISDQRQQRTPAQLQSERFEYASGVAAPQTALQGIRIQVSIICTTDLLGIEGFAYLAGHLTARLAGISSLTSVR